MLFGGLDLVNSFSLNHYHEWGLKINVGNVYHVELVAVAP